MSDIPPSPDSVLQGLAEKGIELPAAPIRLEYCGDSPALSAALIELIRQGRKRAGTSLLWAHETEGRPLPAVGDLEILLDHCAAPALITRLTEVSIVPFAMVTAEYAALEGEGDGSRQHWRQVHWEFFERECRRIGREPSPEMPVVCSVFELLHVLSS